MKIQPGGARLMSAETRLARAGHAQAVRDLREHRRSCVCCERASQRRRPAGMCAEGQALREAEMKLAAQAQENAQLDTLPLPGQKPLW